MKKLVLLFSFSLFAIVASAQLDNDLVLHIPIDGSITDVKGSRSINNTGASLTVDRFGRSNNAITLDGLNDVLDVNFTGLGLDSFAYSVWVKFDDHPADGGLTFILNAGGTTKDAGINLANNYAGYTGFSGFSYTNSGPTANYTTGSLPSKGAWHHIVFSRFSDKVQVYVNGNLMGTSAASGIASYSGGNLGFWVGARVGSSNFLKGIVDDIRVYNRPISSTEVTELYSITNSVVNKTGDRNVSIFPNPSTGKVAVSLSEGQPIQSLKVFDLAGREVQIATTINQNNAELNFLNKGMYILQIISENAILTTQRIVIQ